MNETVLREKVLPAKLENDILGVCYANNFPWFFINDIAYPELSNKNTHCNAYGFFHMVHHDGATSTWNEDARKGLEQTHALIRSAIPYFEQQFGFKHKKIVRIKIGLQTKMSDETVNFVPHIDSPKKHVVVLYYVNTSDGDTVFYKKGNKGTEFARVTPLQGSAVFFDGATHHGGSSPVKHARRIVINFLFET